MEYKKEPARDKKLRHWHESYSSIKKRPENKSRRLQRVQTCKIIPIMQSKSQKVGDLKRPQTVLISFFQEERCTAMGVPRPLSQYFHYHDMERT